MDPAQSLVSRKSSDSGLHIQLHPLVLLTISDHITRHAARQQQGPIVGALLGQQNGREITLEHAFECRIYTGSNGEYLLTQEWFGERVKQCKRRLSLQQASWVINNRDSQRCTQESTSRPCRMVVDRSTHGT